MTRPRTLSQRVFRTLRWSAAILLLTILVVRLIGAAESLAYWPSRDPFPTPPWNQDVWITTEDGVRLHAWLMPARGVAPGAPAPAVLHVHGNAGNIASHDSFSRFLTDAGMHVLIFDYRRYGRSDDTGPLRRAALVADTRAALDALFARPDVDPHRVGVLGVSLGGAFALEAAADDSRVRAVATLSAFSSWQGIASDAAPLLGPLLIPPGVDGVDAAARLGSRPFLVMHGDADAVVPPRHARLLADAAAAAGVRAETWTAPGGDHNGMVQSMPEARERLIAFFAEHLGHAATGGTAPAP